MKTKIVIFVLVLAAVCVGVYSYQEQKRIDNQNERFALEFCERQIAAGEGNTYAIKRLDEFHARANPGEDCKAAKQYIADSLRDADSAKFKCAIESVRTNEGRIMLVEVNAKNGFGAYTGFKTWGVLFKVSEHTVIPPDK